MTKTTCQRCQWIRVFLGMSGLLIVMIGLRPQSAQLVAGMIPSAMVLAVSGMILGTLGFWLRYRAWRKEQAH